MNHTILTVGKIKEKHLSDAIAEYSKRLSRYCKLDIIQVQDEKTPDKPTEVQREQILEKEASRLLPHISDKAFVIALAIDGKQLSSEQLADYIENCGINGRSNIVWIIGGSLGISDTLLKRADFKLSFSKMTFPHQLMRVIMLEQLYRSYRIINKEPYHK